MAVTDAVTPVLYGIQSGMFRDAGLDVQVVTGTNGAAMAAALAGGSLELGASSLVSLITGYTHGVRLPIIAGSTEFVAEAPTTEICVLKTSRVTRVGELNGATFAVQTVRSIDELGIRAAVDRDRGDSSTLKFIEVPPPLLLDALRKGRADAATISEPILAQAMDSGDLRILAPAYGAIASHFLIAAFFCSPTYLAQNRAVIDRFTPLLYRATRYTNTHHAESAPLLAEFAKIDPAIIARMTRATNATALNIQDIQPVINAAAKYNLIERSFPAKELVD